MIEVSISVIEKAWETPTSLNHIFEVKEFDFVIWRYSKGDYIFPDYVKQKEYEEKNTQIRISVFHDGNGSRKSDVVSM